MYRKNTAGQYIGFQLNSTTTGAGVTGASVTVKVCIDGAGAYSAGGGTVTELAGGGYVYALSQGDTNGNDITIQFSAASSITVEKTIVTTAANPTNGVNFGLSALPPTTCTTNASLLTSGTGADQLHVDGSGNLAGSVASVAGNVVGSVGSVTGAVGSVTGAVGSVTAGVTVTTNSDKAGYALSATGLNLVLIGGKPLPNAIKYIGAAVSGTSSGAGTGTETYNDFSGALAFVATIDSNGNRTGMAYA